MNIELHFIMLNNIPQYRLIKFPLLAWSCMASVAVTHIHENRKSGDHFSTFVSHSFGLNCCHGSHCNCWGSLGNKSKGIVKDSTQRSHWPLRVEWTNELDTLSYDMLKMVWFQNCTVFLLQGNFLRLLLEWKVSVVATGCDCMSKQAEKSKGQANRWAVGLGEVGLSEIVIAER